MSHSSDPIIYFVTRKLSTLAGLSTLSHLNLKLIGVSKVVNSHSKTPRSHLLDGRPFPIAIFLSSKTNFVFPSLAAIAFCTDTVHGNRQSSVRFMGNRAKRHRSSGKTLEYTFHGLYFVNRNGNTLLEFKQTTDGQCISGLVINFLGKLLIKPVVVIFGRLLKQMDGFGIEHMRLTPSLPLINATGF